MKIILVLSIIALVGCDTAKADAVSKCKELNNKLIYLDKKMDYLLSRSKLGVGAAGQCFSKDEKDDASSAITHAACVSGILAMSSTIESEKSIREARQVAGETRRLLLDAFEVGTNKKRMSCP